MCRLLPRGSLACYSLPRAALSHVNLTCDVPDMPMTAETPPQDNTLSILRGRIKPLTLARSLWLSRVSLPRLAARIAAFGRAHNVDRFWCILEGQNTIRLARPVADALGVPLYTQVWDYPEYWCRMARMDPISRSLLLREFGAVMRRSTRCAAASPEMVSDLKARFGTPAVSVVGCIDRTLAVNHTPSLPAPESELVIGMAGQLYAAKAWSKMLAAIERSGWRLHGRGIRVRYLGYNAPFGATHGRACIEYLGYRPQEEVISLMASCHVLYVPFFGGPEFDLIAPTSFPAKIATYLATGRPVFIHGPADSPPARFVERTGCGVTCDSREPADILAALTDMTADADRYRSLAANAKKAFLEHLTLDSLAEAVRAFLADPMPTERQA